MLIELLDVCRSISVEKFSAFTTFDRQHHTQFSLLFLYQFTNIEIFQKQQLRSSKFYKSHNVWGKKRKELVRF